jgi:transcriptional antiterminator NusG
MAEHDDTVEEAMAPEEVSGEEVSGEARDRDELDDDTVEEAPGEESPFDRPGSWYVVHCYSGYENKVKSNLFARVRSLKKKEREEINKKKMRKVIKEERG